MIFVFGSNEQGKHAGGAAKVALEQHGAEWGVGFGHKGNSYALPTCSRSTSDPNFEISRETLQFYVYCFILYAKMHPELEFQVTRVGCGLAGWADTVVAPLFNEAPDNCYFDEAWKSLLDSPDNRKYWGTYGAIVPAQAAAVAASSTSNDVLMQLKDGLTINGQGE